MLWKALFTGTRQSRDSASRNSDPRSIARRRLVYEALEDRRLLAADGPLTGNLKVRFEFADTSGAPVETLQVGSEYDLAVYVQDIRSTPTGLSQGYFDVAYQSALLTPTGDVVNDTVEYTFDPRGDALTTSGLIDEAGGTDLVAPRPPADPGAEFLLFSVPFRADAAGTVQFTTSLPTFNPRLPLFHGNPVNIQLGDIDFVCDTYEIVAGGILVTPTSGLVTTEAGGTDTFEIVLDRQPTGDVTIPLTSSNPSEGTVSPSSVTFSTSNWNVPRTITATGVNDLIDDDNVTYTVMTGAATSSDGRFVGANADDVEVTNNDDDTAGISLNPLAGLTTSESGTTATFQIVLDSQPTGDVTIGLVSGNVNEGTVSPSGVTFTNANWNSPQTVTVTGVNDDFVDGAVGYSIITDPATSSDSKYSGFDAANVTLSNLDNDVAGIDISPTSGLVTTEAGGTDGFQVVLTARPTGIVTVVLNSSNTNEGIVSPSSVSFNTNNWNVAQNVTVTGVDDDVVDGNAAFTIATGDPTSSDPEFDGLDASDVPDVSVSNLDLDEAGVLLTAISGDTREDGTTATFTIRLTTQPANPVTVPLNSSDSSEGTLGVSSVTFTDANWNILQNVTVTGVDDDLIDGNVAYSIVTGDPTSVDPNYNTLAAADVVDVAVTNVDQDVAGVTISAISGDTAEDGTTATFSVTLTSIPDGAVTIPLSSSDPGEGSVPNSVQLDATNWNTGVVVTVTGVDDDVIDGNASFTIITGAPASSDSDYNGLVAGDVADVAVINADLDQAAINVSSISGATAEDGTIATFTVTLNSEPAAPVTIPLVSSNPAEGSVPASVELTAANWNTGATVTVTGVDDDVIDGDVDFTVITGDPTSSDTNYSALGAGDVADVSVTNVDQDVAQVNVSAISGDTAEDGTTASFLITLTSSPSGPVTIPLTSSNSGEATVAANVVLDATNWNTGASVTVTGVDDDIIDGNANLQVITGDPVSSDTDYAALSSGDVGDVAVVNLDLDFAGINVTALSGNTAENGTTATFTVKLNSQPSAPVTVPLVSSNPAEATVPATVTLDATNWEAGLTVTVTGVDDDLVDGDASFTIQTGDPTSSDTNYDVLQASDVANVTGTNTDLDTAAVVVTPTSGLTTDESGNTATFTVRLTSQPTAAVTIPLVSSNPAEGSVDASVMLDATNWNTGVTVTVSGVDDLVIDGDQAFTIQTGDPQSTDTNFDNLDGDDVDDVSVVNLDDEIPRVLVNPTSGLTTDEGGATTAVVFTLSIQPTAAVTIPVNSSDLAEGTLDIASVVLDGTNWNTGVTVTATGIDDDVVDGDQTFSIVSGDPTSSDGNYESLDAADTPDVDVTNTDLDTAQVVVSSPTGNTAEDGTTADFTLTLTSQPSGSVMIPLTSSDPGEGTLSVTSVVLTATNWNTGVTVTVTGVDDNLVDGDQTFTIVTGDPASSDADYDDLGAADVADLTISNLDLDTAAILVAPASGLVTTEAGGTATFTVRLANEPTAAVMIPLASATPNEVSVDTAAIVLDATNWDTGVVVTATGVDDDLIDGDQAFTLTTGNPTSADINYDALNAADVDDVTGSNTDLDVASVLVDPTSITVSESGSTATITLRLSSQPAASVTIPVASDNIAEGSLDGTEVVLDATNWNVGATVTVTGVADNRIDGNQSFSITTGDPTSTDNNYDSLGAGDVAEVAATNQDIDTAQVIVTPSTGLTTGEDGASDNFVISLSSIPAASVTIPVMSNNTGEGTIDFSQVVLDSTNWNVGVTVTVTGIDDIVADGDQSYLIVTGDPSSGDSNFEALEASDVADVSVTNQDNDAPRVFVDPLVGLTTDESGGSDTFTIRLATQPSSPVTIPVVSNRTDEVSVSTASVVLDATNWETGVTVTITGVDDDVIDGNQGVMIQIGDPSSSDAGYDALSAADTPDVAATNIDLDVAMILINPVVDLTTTESGGTDTFTVTLSSRPSASVTLPLASTNTAEGTIDLSSVVLDATNWDTGVVVTVTGVDDTVADGDTSYSISTGAPTSADPDYDGLGAENVPDPAVLNQDDDDPGVIVQPTDGLVVDEDGATASFTVRLATEPTAPVTIPIDSSDPGEASASVAAVVLDSTNWDTGVTVTVTGENDDLVDGPINLTITTGDPTSADSDYDALTALDTDDVAVVNQDRDTAAVNVAANDGTIISEAGAAITFSINLSAQPTQDVTIPIAINDATEASVSTASLTFNAFNWNVPQVVTVTGVDDAVVDGDVPVVFSAGPSSSLDADFNGLAQQDTELTNTDDDSATLTLSGVLVSQDEGSAGGTTTFTFQVELTGVVEGGFSVASTVDDGTATVSDGDYVDNDQSLQFQGTAGEVQSIEVQVSHDSKLELDETFNVALGAISGVSLSIADAITINGSPVSATILNDDSTTLTISAATAMEGTGGTVIDLVFQVELANAIQGGLRINFETLDGTATLADNDYQQTQGGLDFVGTAAEVQTITVPVNHDAMVERDEAFTLALGTLANLLDDVLADSITVVGSPANGTISNDDTATVSFDAASSNVIEASGSHSVEVQLSVAAGGELSESITVEISDLGTGTATVGGDYTLQTATVTFPAGSSDGEVRTVNLSIVDDETMEDDETIDLSLAIGADGLSGAVTAGAPSQHQATITDDPMNATAAGGVWVDGNQNGLLDPGEAMVPGVTITLVGQDRRGQDVELQTITDLDGHYQFTGLPAGTYTINQQHPSLFFDGDDFAGTVDSVASGQAGNDSISAIEIGPSAAATDYNFSELGFLPAFVSRRFFLASTPPMNLVIRGMMVNEELRMGNVEQADWIRDLDNGPPEVVVIQLPANGSNGSGDTSGDGGEGEASVAIAGFELSTPILAPLAGDAGPMVPSREALPPARNTRTTDGGRTWIVLSNDPPASDPLARSATGAETAVGSAIAPTAAQQRDLWFGRHGRVVRQEVTDAQDLRASTDEAAADALFATADNWSH